MVMIDIEDRPSSLWRDAWRRLRRNRLAVAGLAVILALATNRPHDLGLATVYAVLSEVHRGLLVLGADRE